MKYRRGFTLVELSIVLVILGLLVGGVLTGQSLIRAAELRSVTAQYSRYQAAVMTFKDKYFAYPGDMTNATKYWGVNAGNGTGTDSACYATASTTAATCNGDGDGYIANSGGGIESFLFWKHLADAGLIEGNYDGMFHGNNFDTTAANAPAGRMSGSYWYVYNAQTYSSDGLWFDGVYNNTFEFGGLQSNDDPWTPIMKPEDEYNIDKKLDDGLPGTGKIVVRASNSLSECTTTSTTSQLSATYLLTATTPNCVILFRNIF